MGKVYKVRTDWGRTSYDMLAGDDTVVASTDHPDCRAWTVKAEGRVYDFQNASHGWWHEEEVLLSGDLRAGSVKQASGLRNIIEARLPGLPMRVQVFVIAMVTFRWRTSTS